MHKFMHLFFYALVGKKEKLHENSYTNFIAGVINFDFRQIWHFDVKGTGRVDLDLTSKTLLKCVSCKAVLFGEVRLAYLVSHVFHSLIQIMNTICKLIYLVSFEN